MCVLFDLGLCYLSRALYTSEQMYGPGCTRLKAYIQPETVIYGMLSVALMHVQLSVIFLSLSSATSMPCVLVSIIFIIQQDICRVKL